MLPKKLEKKKKDLLHAALGVTISHRKVFSSLPEECIKVAESVIDRQLDRREEKRKRSQSEISGRGDTRIWWILFMGLEKRGCGKDCGKIGEILTKEFSSRVV